MLLTPCEVLSEHLTGGRVDWDEARLAEFGASNRQHTRPEVHIRKLEVAGFSQP